MSARSERLVTDVGGLPAGPVPRAERRQRVWEKQLIAIFNLLRLGERPLLSTHEFRRAVEEMSPDVYARTTFYARRLEGVVRLLIEKGVVSAPELEQRTEVILARGTRDHVVAS